MPAPDISIVIVSWNTVDYTLECLRSIIPHTHEHTLEVIVVDNASTDGSADAVHAKFPDVCLIRNEKNLGFAKANNLGIRRSSGRYICLINSDVVVSERCLDRMCEFMDRQTSIGILGPKVLNGDSSLQLSCREFPSLWNSFCRALALDSIFPHLRWFSGSLMRSWTHDQVQPVDVLSGCFWMVRRSALDEVGLLDEEFFMYSEDVDYCKRCWRDGWEIVYFPDVAIVHYGGASSSHAPVRFEVEGLRARLRYWRKHHNRLAQMSFVLITLLHQSRKLLQAAILYILRSSDRKRAASDMQSSVACGRWLLRSGLPGQR
jgi:GT2 family glycosyltransferase